MRSEFVRVTRMGTTSSLRGTPSHSPSAVTISVAEARPCRNGLRKGTTTNEHPWSTLSPSANPRGLPLPGPMTLHVALSGSYIGTEYGRRARASGAGGGPLRATQGGRTGKKLRTHSAPRLACPPSLGGAPPIPVGWDTRDTPENCVLPELTRHKLTAPNDWASIPSAIPSFQNPARSSDFPNANGSHRRHAPRLLVSPRKSRTLECCETLGSICHSLGSLLFSTPPFHSDKPSLVLGSDYWGVPE